MKGRYIFVSIYEVYVTMFKRIAMLATMIGMMLVMGIGTAAAQGTVENYTFVNDAEWLDEAYFARVGGAVNARTIPTDVNNQQRFTFAAGATVKVSAVVNTGTNWFLVRGWGPAGYIGSGWVQENAAKLTRVELLTPALPACLVTDRGEPLTVGIRFNDGWVHDAMSTGCTLFYEGRVEETNEHHYWVARDSNTQASGTVTNTTYLIDGWMWLLEGGAWRFPTTWAIGRGMSATSTAQSLEFPPMLTYFAADKQAVMAQEGYNWPFVIHMVGGTELNFAYGAFSTSNTVDRCDFTEPRQMNITGIYVPASRSFRSTSVGALGCRTIILWQLPNGDYQLFLLNDTDENLLYRFVFTAALIPSNSSNTDLRDYIMDEVIPNADLAAGTDIEVEGIDGMSDFSVE